MEGVWGGAIIAAVEVVGEGSGSVVVVEAAAAKAAVIITI